MIKIIGNHKVQHGDITNGIDQLMLNEKADFIYTDPPWGQGNISYWQTINKKMTGQKRNEIEYSSFIDNFFSILDKFSYDRVIVEYGQKWHNDIIEMSNKHNFIHNGSCKSLYVSGNKKFPLDMHFLSKKSSVKITQDIKDDCYSLSGFKIVSKLFDHYCPTNAQIVLDPMCGMGYTAQATIDRNMSFRGNELNIKRLEKTITRLEK